MKNLFIINPTAGKGAADTAFAEKISERENCEVRRTERAGEAKELTARFAAMHGAENVRVFACGGDGTLNEVVNGAVGLENVDIGCVPMGTGNDFVRNFENPAAFGDIDALLHGDTKKIDLIWYKSEFRGEVSEGYIINMLNIGFDCNVVHKTQELKKKPLLSGTMAYMAGVLTILVKKEGQDLKIAGDGELLHDGPLLQAAAANGKYCGGGVKGLPRASVNDGYMDLSIVKDMTRRRFLRLFPSYAKGTHLELAEAAALVNYRKVSAAAITPNRGVMKICIDGEISFSEKTELRICREAIGFVTPALD